MGTNYHAVTNGIHTETDVPPLLPLVEGHNLYYLEV